MIFTNQSIETTIGTYSSLCKVHGKILRFGPFRNFNGAYRTWRKRRNIRNSYWLVSKHFLYKMNFILFFKVPYIVIDGKSRAKFFLVTCVKMNLKQKNIWPAPIFLAALKWGNNLVMLFQKWVKNDISFRNIKKMIFDVISHNIFNPYFCGWFWPRRSRGRRRFRSYLVWPHKTWNGQLWPSLYFQAKENLEWLKFWNWKNTSGKISNMTKFNRLKRSFWTKIFYIYYVR